MSFFLNRILPRLNSLRLRLYYAFGVKLSLRPKKKRILIVKNDSIGDYIIFRNFLAEIRHSKKFKDYDLYFLTNSRLATITEQLDGTLFKEILLFKREELGSVAEQIAYFKSLNHYAFEYVLHPTYSPDPRIQYIIKYIDARYKVGFDGDLSNQSASQKAFYDPYYTQLIDVEQAVSHEFEKNAMFFDKFLEEKTAIRKPALLPATKVETTKQILICPGAQHAFRIWPLKKFAALITALSADYQAYRFVVVTGPGEEALYEGIKEHTSVPLMNFKIDSILNLITLISGSALVVCNDSSAAHIAVACDTASVCISNGNHYRRFIPYPETMQVKQKVLLPGSLLKGLKVPENIIRYYKGSTLNIDEIEVDTVFNSCKAYLENLK